MADARYTAPNGKWTPAWLAALPPPPRRTPDGKRGSALDLMDPDNPGLCFRLAPSGTASWRWNGPDGWITLGRFGHPPRPGHMTHKQAQVALEGLRQAAEGGTLASAVMELHAAYAIEPPTQTPNVGEGITVEEVAREWYAMLCGPIDHGGVKHPEKMERTLRLDILPAVGPRVFSEVKAPEWARIVEGVRARGAPVHAGTVLQHVKLLGDFAVGKGYAEDNRAARLRPRALGVRSGVSTRALTAVEIPLVWHGLDRRHKGKRGYCHGLEERTKLAIRLLALIPCRSGELLLADKSEVDWDRALWTIPPEHQKHNPRAEAPVRPFPEPLSPLVLRLMRRAFELTGDHPRILGGMDEKALAHAMRRVFGATKDGPALVALPGDPEDLRCGKNPPTPHDWRHTFATRYRQGCGAGQDPLGLTLLLEACLNHSQGFIGRYQHDTRLEERREVLLRWSVYVARLVGEREGDSAVAA